MENKRGQVGGVLITIFIVVITGLALFPTVAQIVGDSTNTIVGRNHTNITVANATTYDLVGQELFTATGDVLVYNVTGDATLLSGATRNNFTFQEGISATTGLKTIQLVVAGSDYQSNVLQLGYDYGQDGYLDNGGGRSVAALITIFFALAIAVVVLIPVVRSGVMDMMR